MLTIIPNDKWSYTITAVRLGRFPSKHGLRDMEKYLINELLSPLPQDRPADIDDIISVISLLMKKEQGNNTIKINCSFQLGLNYIHSK